MKKKYRIALTSLTTSFFISLIACFFTYRAYMIDYSKVYHSPFVGPMSSSPIFVGTIPYNRIHLFTIVLGLFTLLILFALLITLGFSTELGWLGPLLIVVITTFPIICAWMLLKAMSLYNFILANWIIGGPLGNEQQQLGVHFTMWLLSTFIVFMVIVASFYCLLKLLSRKIHQH